MVVTNKINNRKLGRHLMDKIIKEEIVGKDLVLKDMSINLDKIKMILIIRMIKQVQTKRKEERETTDQKVEVVVVISQWIDQLEMNTVVQKEEVHLSWKTRMMMIITHMKYRIETKIHNLMIFKEEIKEVVTRSKGEVGIIGIKGKLVIVKETKNLLIIGNNHQMIVEEKEIIHTVRMITTTMEMRMTMK